MDFLAPQKEFESPTFRLGGGRSILLSYWGVCCYILPNFFHAVKKIRHFFCFPPHIIHWHFQKGAKLMRESNDPNADLEDLIFDEDAGGPSQR